MNRNLQEFTRKYLRTKNAYARAFLSEFLATFLLCALGLAACAQNLFNSTDDSQLASGLSVAISFGFAAGLGVLTSGRASGAAANPAVSFCSLLHGRIDVATMLVHWLAQLVGAFLASAAVFLAYYDSLKAFKNGMYR